MLEVLFIDEPLIWQRGSMQSLRGSASGCLVGSVVRKSAIEGAGHGVNAHTIASGILGIPAYPIWPDYVGTVEPRVGSCRNKHPSQRPLSNIRVHYSDDRRSTVNRDQWPESNGRPSE